MKTRLKAVTLPMVLVISVLIILVVLFVYSLWEMNFFHYSSYHYKKTTTGEPEFRHCLILQRQYFFLRNHNEEKDYRLYEADSTSIINFLTKQWGFYEVVSVSSHNGSFSSTRLLGKKTGMQS